MRVLSYIFYNYFFKYILKLYLKTDSTLKFDKLRVKVFKEVFHPGIYFSTKYLYSFLKNQDLKNKSFLEIGSGSGILSLLAYEKGADVTSIDIDPKAVENTRFNFVNNFGSEHKAIILESDLFNSLPEKKYDVIVVNPPYYFKKVEVPAHYAWYCGENGEYFDRFFAGLKNCIHPQTETYMILQENCEIKRIESIAAKYHFMLKAVAEKRINWELNIIYLVVSDN